MFNVADQWTECTKEQRCVVFQFSWSEDVISFNINRRLIAQYGINERKIFTSE
jgi:hypothetical protein